MDKMKTKSKHTKETKTIANRSNGVMPARPLVALLDGRDCSIEMPLLKDIATVAFCDAQMTHEIHEKVLEEAIAALLYNNITLRREDLEKFKALKLIVRIGHDTDNIDVKSAAELGIAVSASPSALCLEEVADFTLAQILELYRRPSFWSQSYLANNSNNNDLNINNVNNIEATVQKSTFSYMANNNFLHRPGYDTNSDNYPTINTRFLTWANGTPQQCARIRNQTLGLLGLGKIGRAVAVRAKAFGFNVIYHDPYLSHTTVFPNHSQQGGRTLLSSHAYNQDATDKILGITAVKTLKEFLTQCDCISLHLTVEKPIVYGGEIADQFGVGNNSSSTHLEPSMDDLVNPNCCMSKAYSFNKDVYSNRHIISEETLKYVKNGAFIINTSQMELIDEVALVGALKMGKLGGAALDIQEHLYESSTLLKSAPNLIVTPRTAWFSDAALLEMREESALEVRRFLLTVLNNQHNQYSSPYNAGPVSSNDPFGSHLHNCVNRCHNPAYAVPPPRAPNEASPYVPSPTIFLHNSTSSQPRATAVPIAAGTNSAVMARPSSTSHHHLQGNMTAKSNSRKNSSQVHHPALPNSHIPNNNNNVQGGPQNNTSLALSVPTSPALQNMGMFGTGALNYPLPPNHPAYFTMPSAGHPLSALSAVGAASSAQNSLLPHEQMPYAAATGGPLSAPYFGYSLNSSTNLSSNINHLNPAISLLPAPGHAISMSSVAPASNLLLDAHHQAAAMFNLNTMGLLNGMNHPGMLNVNANFTPSSQNASQVSGLLQQQQHLATLHNMGNLGANALNSLGSAGAYNALPPGFMNNPAAVALLQARAGSGTFPALGGIDSHLLPYPSAANLLAPSMSTNSQLAGNHPCGDVGNAEMIGTIKSSPKTTNSLPYSHGSSSTISNYHVHPKKKQFIAPTLSPTANLNTIGTEGNNSVDNVKGNPNRYRSPYPIPMNTRFNEIRQEQSQKFLEQGPSKISDPVIDEYQTASLIKQEMDENDYEDKQNRFLSKISKNEVEAPANHVHSPGVIKSISSLTPTPSLAAYPQPHDNFHNTTHDFEDVSNDRLEPLQNCDNTVSGRPSPYNFPATSPGQLNGATKRPRSNVSSPSSLQISTGVNPSANESRPSPLLKHVKYGGNGRDLTQGNEIIPPVSSELLNFVSQSYSPEKHNMYGLDSLPTDHPSSYSSTTVIIDALPVETSEANSIKERLSHEIFENSAISSHSEQHYPANQFDQQSLATNVMALMKMSPEAASEIAPSTNHLSLDEY